MNETNYKTIIDLLEGDLLSIHDYLDLIQIPRKDSNGEEYSIIGRIRQMERNHFVELSHLEDRINQSIDRNNKLDKII